MCENTSYELLSRYMILLTLQHQYLTDVAMTCYYLRRRRSFSHSLRLILRFSREIMAKVRVAWAEGRAG